MPKPILGNRHKTKKLIYFDFQGCHLLAPSCIRKGLHTLKYRKHRKSVKLSWHDITLIKCVKWVKSQMGYRVQILKWRSVSHPDQRSWPIHSYMHLIGGWGGEPHAGGSERRVERDDDGARLHQGHGQVGHRLESGGRASKQPNNQRKQTVNIKTRNRPKQVYKTDEISSQSLEDS